MHAFYQVVVPYQIQLVCQRVVVPHEHEGGHVPVKRIVSAVEEYLRDDMAGAMAEYAITHSRFGKQVRHTERAVSAGVETEYVGRLRYVALRSVVTVAFVEAMGDVEVEDRQRLFPVGRKPLYNRVRDRLLGEEVDGAYSQPRVDHVGRANVLRHLQDAADFSVDVLGEVSRIRVTHALSHGRRLPVGTVHHDRLPATEYPNLTIRLAPDTLLLTNTPFLGEFLDLVD